MSATSKSRALSTNRTQRDALAAARQGLIDELQCTTPPHVSTASVLCRDGDTIIVTRTGKRITHERVAGHVTGGMWVDPSDLPCVC